MEPGNIAEFFRNKTILITGTTGFLAKVLVEKIIRIQPNVKKLYLVVRAANTSSAEQRLQVEVFEKDLFRVVREGWGAKNLDKFIKEKVIAVPGDVSLENLGIKDSNLKEQMWEEVDFIINSAATTRFDERYDISLRTNTFGAFNVVSFAKRCVKVNMLLHVSTAYVFGEREGVIPERQFLMGETLRGETKLDVDAEKTVVEEKLKLLYAQNATEETITSAMKDLGLIRARMYGWPNTYAFTKAMGEMVVGHYRDNLSLIIVRPSSVTSTYKEPFPGWIEGMRTLDTVIVGYGKGKLTCFLGRPSSVVDMIPADMVINTMLMAMVAHNANDQSLEIVYHVGSSFRNPITLSIIRDFVVKYFKRNPWIGTNGKPIRYGKFTFLSTNAKFHIYILIRFVLPLEVLGLVNTLSCKLPYSDAYKAVNSRKLLQLMRLVDLYRPYALSKSIFEDKNTEKLRMAARAGIAKWDPCNSDPTSIGWEDYVINIQIPGLLKYVVK